VTLIQRFGSPLNANIHFHMFVLDGVCRMSGAEAPLRFVPAAAPDETEHAALLQRIAERIATGPREVQKVFTRRTLPAARDPSRADVTESSGFSRHARVRAATERFSLTDTGHMR